MPSTPQSGNPTPPLMAPQQGIRTAQIICGAMMAGVIMFGGIVLTRPGQPNGNMLIAYLALGFASVMIVLRFIVPASTARTATAQIKGTAADLIDARLFGVFQTKMIIGLALLEGSAFFNLIAYMIGQQWWSLAMVGFLLLLMAMMFPTLTKFESWAEDIKRGWQNEF